MDNKYIYAGNPASNIAWKCILDTTEARAEAIQDGYTAFSIYSFDYEPEKDKAKPICYGSLWVVINCKDNPCGAILAVRHLVDSLDLCGAIDIKYCNLYLNGYNGMHVEIPAKLYGGCEGHTDLHKIHKIMVQMLSRICCRVGMKNIFIDDALYCDEQGKLLWATNVQRPDGRYKVPISLSELMDIAPRDLLELTKEPREDFSRPEAALVEGNLVDIYNLALNLWKLNKQSPTTVKRLEAIEQCTFIEHCHQNQASLSELDWFKMIKIFAQVGAVARPLAHQYSMAYPSYTKQETDKKFNYALTSEHRITCTDIKESYDCQRDCAVRSPADLGMKNDAKRESAAMNFTCKEDGVYYNATHEDPSQAIRICSPLTVLGKMRQADGTGWARLVELISPDGKQKKICLPMRECSGRGDSVKALLADCGLEISPYPKCGQLLLEYICYGGTDKLFLHVTKTGWHDNTYVLPDSSFGTEREEEVYFENRSEGLHKTQGNLEEWQEQVGSLCTGNSLLVLATSFALTAPLLRQVGIEGGGLHIYGASSTGKTTCALVAGSVCGGGGKNGYVRQWRSTDNALENTATMHNDNLLVLDEVGQAKAEAINNVAYMLANGQGRERMRSDTTSQKTRTWMLNFLSTGELTINDKIEETGRHKAMAGQAVRIIDLPIDKGCGCNLFTEKHSYSDTAELGASLAQHCTKAYGTPLRAFLKRYCDDITGHNEQICKYVESYVENNLPPQSTGQVQRVLRKFALIAAAGELAIEWDIFPYQKGEAEAAAKEWFGIWVEQRGSVGDLEVENVLLKIQEHFETEKDKYRINGDSAYPYPYFGYKCQHNNKAAFLMLSSKVKEFFTSAARTTILKVLKDKGWVALTDTGNIMETKSISGSNHRGLVFIPSVWKGEKDRPVAPCVDECDDDDLFYLT